MMRTLLCVLCVKTYAERARSAAGRLLTKYPTIALAIVEPKQVLRIGAYDTDHWAITEIDADQADAFRAWLTPEALPDAVAPEAIKYLLYRSGLSDMPRGVGFWNGDTFVAEWTVGAFLDLNESSAIREQLPQCRDARTMRFRLVDGRDPIYWPE